MMLRVFRNNISFTFGTFYCQGVFYIKDHFSFVLVLLNDIQLLRWLSLDCFCLIFLAY